MDARESKLAKKFDIIRLYNDGFSEREIQLATNIPKSTIHDTISKYDKYGTVMRLSGSGRPRALNDEDMKFLVESVEEYPKKQVLSLHWSLRRREIKWFRIELSEMHLMRLVLIAGYRDVCLSFLLKTFPTD